MSTGICVLCGRSLLDGMWVNGEFQHVCPRSVAMSTKTLDGTYKEPPMTKEKTITEIRLEQGNEYPYDRPDDYEDGATFPATDWAHAAARGIIADLSDRRGIKHSFGDVDEDVRKELVQSIAEIIREANRKILEVKLVPSDPSKPITFVNRVIPDGFVLVPIEPTMGMYDDFCLARPIDESPTNFTGFQVRYKAMIAASKKKD